MRGAWLAIALVPGLGCDAPRPRESAISRAELMAPDRVASPASAEPRSVPDDFADVSTAASSASAATSASVTPPPSPPDEAAVLRSLDGRRPRRFGDSIPGVVTRFRSDDAIALTLDLCDGASPRAFDQELFDLLAREGIPATLFVSGRWLRHHEERLAELAKDPRYSIQNHGLSHRPCTVDGRSQYGIRGTLGLSALIEEVDQNAREIAAITGRWPRFYRSGTAHFDDVCVDALGGLRELPTGFTVAADGGLGFNARQVRAAVEGARPGSILLLHAHRPSGSSFEGLRDALPALRQRKLRFVKLDEVL